MAYSMIFEKKNNFICIFKQVSKINPRVKPPPKPKENPKKLSAAQMEDLKNIKLDEVSAKWICPYKGKKKGEGDEKGGDETGENGEMVKDDEGETKEGENGKEEDTEGIVN